jgi:hypothetical protein
MQTVVTPEEPVADRDDVMEKACGQEEDNYASENACYQSGMGVNGVGDSGYQCGHRDTSILCSLL